MSKAVCPAGCGKRFITEGHATTHADESHPDWRNPKRKGWCTPFGFGDWKEPITYEEACKQMQAMAATIKWPDKEQGRRGSDDE